MTRKDRCSYRWKRLERKSTRRHVGGGLAAERGIGVQRVEAVPVPGQARCRFSLIRTIFLKKYNFARSRALFRW